MDVDESNDNALLPENGVPIENALPSENGLPIENDSNRNTISPSNQRFMSFVERGR